MTSLKRNVVASFLGSLCPSFMSFAFIPLYIHFMGIEAFGLIGFFTTLIGLLSFLDLGLSATINRELARLSLLPDRASEMGVLARTLEVIYWILGVGMGIGISLLAPMIATRWLVTEATSPVMATAAVRMMGIALVLRWPYAFYAGGLMGLQEHVSMNLVRVTAETLRSGGAALVLWLYSPTITTFFSWNICVYLVQIITIAIVFWNHMPSTLHERRFSLKCLRHVWRFAAGVTSISVLSTILMQLDKVILSRMLTLKDFGYYILASTLALGLSQIVAPIFAVVYPRITQLVSLKEDEKVENLYHASCLLISIVVLPITVVVASNAREILFLWTQNDAAANSSFLILRILMIGISLNAILNVPYALQLSHGWISLALYGSVLSVVLLVPMLIVATLNYGATGAAASWTIMCSVQVFIFPFILHKRILKGHFLRWCIDDTGKPLIITLIAVTVCHVFLAHLKTIGPAGVAIFLSLSYLAACGMCLVTFDLTRTFLQTCVGKMHCYLRHSSS